MLYEPPKTKKYILIFGAIAFVLAVLVIVAAPLIYKQKTSQIPTANIFSIAEQKKSENSLKKLEKLETSQNPQPPTQEQIQNSLQELQKQEKESVSVSSQDEIQKSLENLSKMQK